MNISLQHLSEEDIAVVTHTRDGETKLGETVSIVTDLTNLVTHKNEGCQFAIVGICEDIGPRANHGRGGAQHGWNAFLSCFCNLQSNSHMSGHDILLVGSLQVESASEDDLEQLRKNVAELDNRVSSLVGELLQAGFTPIVIGGGHNNCYPILQACCDHHDLPMAVVNMDPHADFRQTEGRHSGNGFRYAYDDGVMSHYSVVGMHEQKNTAESLSALKEAGFPMYSIQDTHWRRTLNFDQVLEDTARYLLHSGLPIGVELDMDAIEEMPSSAITSAGVALRDALYYVTQMAALPKVSYLHLAEAAPDPNDQTQVRRVGQSLTELVSSFVKQMTNIDEG